jgi:hypothetical protein
MCQQHLFLCFWCLTCTCAWLPHRIETTGKPGWYFDRLIWPSYLKYNRAVLEMPQQVLVVDGSADKHELVRAVVDFVEGRPVDDVCHRAKLQRVLQKHKPPGLLSWF